MPPEIRERIYEPFFTHREAGSAASAPQYDEIHLTGNPANHGHLLITDRKGNRLGYVRGMAVFEINHGSHHDHIVCLDCGRVEEFYDAEIEKRRAAAESGIPATLAAIQRAAEKS